MSEGYCYKVRVEFVDDVGGVPAYPPQTIAVSRNHEIMSVEDAVKHCMAITAVYFYPGSETPIPVTRIHHKDDITGERFSIKTCVPVRAEPFPLSEAPRVRSFADAPKKEVP